MEKTCQIRIDTLSRNYYIGVGSGRRMNEYKTFKGALRAAARLGYVCETTIDPMIEFLKNDKKTKIVTNLIGGKLVHIPVNTPLCCDPSSETYWSM